MTGEPADATEARAADWLQKRRYWKDWSPEDQAVLDAWLENPPATPLPIGASQVD